MTTSTEQRTSSDGGSDAPAETEPAAGGERPGRRNRLLKRLSLSLAAVLALAAGGIVYSSSRTEADIGQLRDRVEEIGVASPSPDYDPVALGRLPEPVQRYFEFVFVERPEPVAYVTMTSSGDFRRPLTDGFNPTTAEQTIASGNPSLMFSARTNLIPGLWARAYDFYADGEMEMKAKVLSTLTVVDESETPDLNRTSLQRWLLETPLHPVALLPGGPVRWEPIDDRHARAVVSANGIEASLVASFGQDGRLDSFDAEHDGDLTTPYHGSGERAERSDYRLVNGMMIPHRFVIARVSDGRTYPFYDARLDSIEFETAGPETDR